MHLRRGVVTKPLYQYREGANVWYGATGFYNHMMYVYCVADIVNIATYLIQMSRASEPNLVVSGA